MEQLEGKKSKLGKVLSFVSFRWRMVLRLVLLAVVVIGLLLVYRAGVNKGKDKAGNEIATLKDQIEELDDKVKRYELLTKTVSIGTVDEQINTIGELATKEYRYTDVVKYEDKLEVIGKEINLGLTTKSFLVKYEGIIKVGVDIQKLKTSLDSANKVITVTLPKAEILSHEIDEDSYETLDERSGLFNPISVDDVHGADGETKKAMEKKIQEYQLFEDAYEEAQNIITNILNANPVIKQYYSIKFAEAK